MSMVQHQLADARVIDLFAGSGALGLEALSRGAVSADFVELSAASLRAIRENGAALGALGQIRIHRADAERFVLKLEPAAFDVAFADPPYDLGIAPRLVSFWMQSPFATTFGVEHTAREAMPVGGDTRVYGGTAVTIYRVGV
jgi:16S rRNA (guanine(966)-N(2))-methyltransferase RsmD